MCGWENHKQFKVCGEREKETKILGFTTCLLKRISNRENKLDKYHIFLSFVASFIDGQLVFLPAFRTDRCIDK